MIAFFVSLMIASFVGTILWLALRIIRPWTQKYFSQTWHYYSCLIPVFFLLGGTGMMNKLIPFVRSMLPSLNTSPDAGQMAERSIYVISSEQATANGSSLMTPIYDSIYQIGHLSSFVLVAMILWLVGVVTFLGVSITRYWKFRRSIFENSRFCENWDETKAVISPSASTPMVIGFIKPVVVLPNTDFKQKELTMILSHERIHLQRRDLLVKLIVLIANAIHWFNPAAYSMNRQTHMFCELSCDEKVVQEMDQESRKIYGNTLLSVMEYGVMRRNMIGTSSLCSTKKEIKRRLNNLMKVKKTKKSLVILSVALAISVVGSGGVVAHISESAKSEIPNTSPIVEVERSAPIVSIPTDPNVVAGYNVFVENPDGTIEYWDKEGNMSYVDEVPTGPPNELTVELSLERLQRHLDKGLALPEGYIVHLKEEGEIDRLRSLLEGYSTVIVAVGANDVTYEVDELLAQ